MADPAPARTPTAPSAKPVRALPRDAGRAQGRWLVKTEPKQFSYADLEKAEETPWDGVSNALALIHLRGMAVGDLVLVYHTGKEKAVAGLARVSKGPRPDPKATGADATRLVVVDLAAVAPARPPVPLATIKAEPRCRDLALLRLPRLSVMPVDDAAWAALTAAAGLPG